MQIRLNELSFAAYSGLRLVFESSDLSQKRHFHAWLVETAKLELGTALEFFSLASSISTEAFSDEDRELVLVAREVAAFLLAMCREAHEDPGNSALAAYVKWATATVETAGRRDSSVVDAQTIGAAALQRDPQGKMRVRAHDGDHVVYDRTAFLFEGMWAGDFAWVRNCLNIRTVTARSQPQCWFT